METSDITGGTTVTVVGEARVDKPDGGTVLRYRIAEPKVSDRGYSKSLLQVYNSPRLAHDLLCLLFLITPALSNTHCEYLLMTCNDLK